MRFYALSMMLICFPMLVSCALPLRGGNPFDPERVSCNIRSIPEAHAWIQELRKNPGGDLYLMAHVDDISAHMRSFADQGDPEAIFLFGDIRRESKEIGLLRERNSGVHKPPFPDEVKNDITIATTYLYLSASVDSPYRSKAQELVNEIERTKFDWTTSTRMD